MKKNNLVLTSILLIVSYLLTPITTFGETLPSNREEVIQLYQTVKEIELDNGVTLLEGTYIFGESDKDSLKLQFADSKIVISDEFVDIVEKDTPIYSEYPDETGQIYNRVIESGTYLYTVASNGDALVTITINKDIELPVYINKMEQEVVLIGNVQFYFNEESSEQLDKQTSEKILQETVLNEVIEESKGDPKTSDGEVGPNPEAGITGEQEHVSEINANLELPEEEQQNDEQKAKGKELVSSNSVEIASVNPWENNNSKYFEVITDDLVVYDNRVTPKIPVGKLEKGQVYPRVSDYGNWHRIQYGDFYGYVKKSDTMPSNGSKLKNENTSYTNQSLTIKAKTNLKVYDNTSGNLVPFGEIEKGQTYPIVSDYGNWWRIIYADRVGYIRKSEVETQFTKSDKYFRANSNVAIYDNRGNSLTKVGELIKGQVYPRISDYGNWHRIDFGNFYGYVKKSETSVASGGSIKNFNKNHSNQSRTFKPKETITVYDNTSGKLVPFGEINKGQTYPIAYDYGNWWGIVYAERVGYIRKSEVETQFTSKDKYFRANNNVAVYDNRGSSLKKVGELVKGQVYPRVSDYGNWHRIDFGSFYGYVKKSETSLATNNLIKNKNKSYTDQSRTMHALDTLTVYDNTSGSLVPFGKIEKDQGYPLAFDYGNWWGIIYSDRIGYIRKDEVKVEIRSGDKYFRVFSDLPVYDNRTGSLIRVGKLEEGQSYPIHSDYGNWWRVQFGDVFGYVRKIDTGFATKGEIKNFEKYNKNSTKKISIVQNVIVYDNTSGKLVPFGELTSGVEYPIASDYGNWWRIIYLDRIGYINKNKANGINAIVKEYRKKDTSASVNRIKQFFISPSSNYVASANNMLEEKYKISGYGTFDFTQGIPWGKSPVSGKEYSRSYYRALHAHFFINDLIAAYKENGNEEYIYKGYEVIEDWITKNPYGNAQHSLAWHDEGTARRLVTWVNFYDVARKILDEQELEFLITNMIKHAEILSTDEFHSTNSNHGMFQDEALIVFSDYFSGLKNSQKYNEVGKKRLMNYFDFIISDEGVHLEHSPSYHQIIAQSVKGYRDYFSLKPDKNQLNYYTRLYNSMANYQTWVIKPDGSLPAIGDTFYNLKPTQSLWQDNEYYKYSSTGGKEGIMPEGHSVVFEEAGYAIFREDWNKGAESAYIHFTAAYHTDYHKHSDDLSVWIYANGHDIITEAGPNGYDYHLPLTEFGYSSFAHNTLIVNDSGLPRVDYHYDKTYLLDYSLGEKISKVSGINKRYKDVTHQRDLTYNRVSNEITVKDKINSNKKNNYKILWNLADNVVPELNGNSVNLYIDGIEVMSLIVNGSDDTKIKVVKGQTNPYLLGWHITKQNQPVETYSIIIEAEEVDTEIQTIFTIK